MDHERTVVTEASLREHYSLVFFDYTRCRQICGFTIESLQLTLEELGTAADNILVYFITVDPERDTRAVLAEYVRGLHPNVRALTGTDEQIEAALAAFGAERADALGIDDALARPHPIDPFARCEDLHGLRDGDPHQEDHVAVELGGLVAEALRPILDDRLELLLRQQQHADGRAVELEALGQALLDLRAERLRVER